MTGNGPPLHPPPPLPPPLFHSHPDAKNKMSNYRYWDVDEWRAAVRREKAKKKERRALLTVCAVGIIVFIAVSYFGTLLFLRITKFPVTSSSSMSPHHHHGM